jgi:hypothetical protein
MSGKGSSPRPFSVSQEKFGSNFDAIFRKPSPKEIDDSKAEDEEFERIAKQFDKQVIMKPDFSE